jgi:hypothetical protein
MRDRMHGGEEGAIVILFAILIPVLVLLAMITVDTANWFVHKRQLQIKADAAALAGAGAVIESIDAATGTCSEAAVEPAVVEFGGAIRNPSLGGPAADLRTTPDLTSSPCADRAVDVTVTEDDVPFLFSLVPGASLEAIAARARVDFQTIGRQIEIAPLGVPLPPDEASITVRNAGTGTVIQTVPMTALQGFDPAGRKLFTASMADVPIATNATVDVTLGSGTTIANAGYIRGWVTPNSTGSTNPVPQLGEVELETNVASCPADNFGRPYYFSSRTNCAVGIRAQIDWNDSVIPAEVVNQKVWAVTGGASHELKYDSALARWYSLNNDIPVPAGVGARDITIRYAQQTGFVGGTGNSAKCPRAACNGTFSGIAARPYSAAGETLGRFEIGGTKDADPLFSYVSGLNSVPRNSTPNLTFTVGVASNLSLGGQIRTLRLSGTNQTGGINCYGQNGAWDNFFETGCLNAYAINQRGDECNPELPVRDCLDPRTGGAPDPSPALTSRIGCSANNYPDDIDDDDPRLVSVALVDFGSFSGSGGSGTNDAVPVRGFADFYITGWTDNQGTRNPCAEDAYPATTGDREIYGRFVRRIDTTGPGQTGSGTACTFTDIYGCVAVMTH